VSREVINCYSRARQGKFFLADFEIRAGWNTNHLRSQLKFGVGSGLLFPTALAIEPLLETLRNISAGGLVGTGDDVLIGGFIVGGNALATNAVVVRALGPSLSQAGG
jgi:hypothetical protein